MALFSQGTAKEVSTRTCFHPDQGSLQVGGKRDQLLLGELLPQQYLPNCAEGHEVKGRLAEINPYRTNLHISMILLESANTITHFNREIKRRTISLTGFSV